VANQDTDDIKVIRLPFVGENTGRDYAYTKDRYFKNLYVELYDNDRSTIVKRPGLQVMDDGGDTCHDGLPSLGLYSWGGELIGVFGNTIYHEIIGAPVVWTRVTDMPTAVTKCYGESIGDDFFVFGGSTSITVGSAASATVQKYVKATDTWSSPTTLPQGGRVELIAAKLPNGQIYVGGGASTYGATVNAKSDVYWYNPGTNTWTAKNPLPFAWIDARVGVLSDGKLLIFGGRNTAGSYLATTYLYDPGADSYTAKTSMNTARSNLTSVVLENGLVVAIGGETGAAVLTSVELYDPTANTWTAKASLPVAVQYASAAAIGDYIYVWGGGTNTGNTTFDDAIYAYSTNRNEWTTLVNFPIAFYGSGYDRYDDGVYINAGGYNATDGVSKRVYITDTSTPTIQCTSLGNVTEGEPGVTIEELSTQRKLIIKTSKSMYIIDSTTLAVTTVTDVDYPAITVPGTASVDGYVFVMDPNGVIYNSDLEDPTSWNALNFITAEIESDYGVALTKHLNYVLALGTRSYELFDNAANATGSPLGRVEAAFKPIGCIAPWSVAHIGDATLWIGRLVNDDPVVVLLLGFDAKVISDHVIQRILKNYGNDIRYAKGIFAPIGGHSFYIIQLGHFWNQFDRTLVYDINSMKWFEWTTIDGEGEGCFNVSNATIRRGDTVVSGVIDGLVYRLSSGIYQDGGQNINFEARTESWDGDIAIRKFVSLAKLIGDLQTVSGSTIDFDYSDDNYKTFSTARSVSLQTLPGVTRLGMTDRRTWRVKSTANSPIRLDGIDIVFSVGEYLP
jgi:N-acetylneuraminic acid mutarotase